MRTRIAPLPMLVACLGTLATAPLAAQSSPWIDRGQRTAAWAELSYPSFKAGDFSALFLHVGARFGLGSSLRAVVELPVATSSSDDAFFGEDDGVLLGNPYLGVETEPTTGGAHFAFGVRVPIVSTDAPGLTTLAALLADYDRLEAYVPDLLTVQAEAAQRWRMASGLMVDLGLSPILLKPDEGDVEILANYRLGAGIASGSFEVLLSLTGRWTITAEGASFSEATVHHAVVSASLTKARIRPTFFARLPLDDDLKEGLSSVIGAGVTLGF